MNNKIILGSLFDGSGGFPLAAEMCGITPIWASEIEEFPIEVTSRRFPNMKHLGDIRKINGAEIPPVDIITFGSPCQDLSVAGTQKGLDGERSKLFREAIRIIKEMREKTNGIYPAFAVWENVPGAFSSNKGEDFRTVLKEFCEICGQAADVPRPPKGKWNTCGCILGDGFSVTWRVLDAQYWGVPQRRRRIFLVADLRGERAAEILFKREGLSRNFKESKKAWERAAAASEGGVRVPEYAAGFKGQNSRTAGGVSYCDNQSPTLSAKQQANCLCYSCGNGQADNSVLSEKMQTLSCMHDQQAVLCFDARGNGDGTIAPTITGDHNDRVTDNQGENAKYDFSIEENKVQTLVAKGPSAIAEIWRWIVRRLMPIECCRLQGFPDWWCSDVPHSDTAEYKMWGNGVALPCVLYIMEGIKSLRSLEEIEKLKEAASKFSKELNLA